ncbi:hypothetical protein SUGI_0878760 [Cryptomeria japonica]|uniref:acyl-CoA-binding domain-containing protein 1 n=1 Tax=Cryptomeria japonica TaxID=3369 RepID=UPI002414A8C1|nr:acyl-CoA-binding domain-containing protein 1 [Cryptomeria japonica]GLJ42408.1 hypothetical protein SUGI_0878760 [Cryptomeria japonica]
MGDWVELAQSAFIALIFAFMLAKLISIVISFRDDNLRITRDVDRSFVPEVAGEAETMSEVEYVEEERVPGRNVPETIETHDKIVRNEGFELQTLGSEGLRIETPIDKYSEIQIQEEGEKIEGLEAQNPGKEIITMISEGLDVETRGKDGKTLVSEGLELQTQGEDVKTLRGKGLEVHTLESNCAEGKILGTGSKAVASEGFREEIGAGSLHGESDLGDEEDDDWEGVESTELDEAFGAAASYIATMAGQSAERISNDVQLQFYGLYKLATEGPCTVPQPSALKMTARAKWNAWQRLGTMSPEVAMQKYISLLTEIKPSWADGIKQKSRKQDEESSHQSGTRGAIGPVFSSFVSYEGSDDETKLEIIHSYASEGDTTGLLQVLEHGTPVDMKDSQGRTALHWAADRGQLKTLEILVSKGADINAKDMEGQTPLHYAFVCELEDIAKYLIDHGADVSIKDNDGDAPCNICPTKWTWMSGNA